MVAGSREEEEYVEGVICAGGGDPGKNCFVEDDVGGDGDTSVVAEENVEGVWGVETTTEVDAWLAAGGVSGFAEVGGVVCDDGGAPEGQEGKQVGGGAV